MLLIGSGKLFILHHRFYAAATRQGGAGWVVGSARLLSASLSFDKDADGCAAMYRARCCVS